MQRVSYWSLIVVAVTVFVAAGYVVLRNSPVHDAGQVLPLPSAAAASSDASDASGGGASDGADHASMVVAFLGDDWTSGTGASSHDKRFTTLVADALGVREKNFSADGGGYARPDPTGGTYQSHLAALVKAHPQVVVVSGGRNDVTDFGPTLRADVQSLFNALRAELPHATLIALAPMWGDSDAPAVLAPVTSAVKQYVTAAGGHYVAVHDPLHDHPSYMSDAADPNDKGYAAIAAAVTPKLKALLPS